MKSLLIIRSSLFNGSGQSSQMVAEFARHWRTSHPEGRVLCRDLAADPLPHLTAEAFSGFGMPADQRNSAQTAATAISDSLIAELKSVDLVAVGLPMYNFTIPSTFKAWMDYVARAGVTFEYRDNGPHGLIDDKPVYVFAARGGQYQGTPTDTQTGLIKTFFGFLGLQDVRFVYAEGLAAGEPKATQVRQSALEDMLREAA